VNCSPPDTCIGGKWKGHDVHRTHVPNLHIIMRRADWGRWWLWPFCLNVINPYWGSVWGFTSIIEISARKFKIRLISEVLVNSVWAYDNEIYCF
jgi:hypothetical protein